MQINVCLMNKTDWHEWKKFAGEIVVDKSYKDYLLANDARNLKLKHQPRKI